MLTPVLYGFVLPVILVLAVHRYAFTYVNASDKQQVIRSVRRYVFQGSLMIVLGICGLNLDGVNELWFSGALALLFGTISGEYAGNCLILVKKARCVTTPA